MKKCGLFAEILNAVIKHNRNKVRNSKPDHFLDQKKQLWFRMMNVVDEDIEAKENSVTDEQE